MKKLFSLFLAVLLALTLCPAVTASAAPSVSGQTIVNKAREYIGKVPYVWGGETIDGKNPGADCSGFICRIYEKYGIDMWAHRTQLRKCGTNIGTDLSQAKLGDIIWFEGHVAIYSGKNSKNEHMIVHETTSGYNNVVETTVKRISNSLPVKGIIRIPGVNGAAAAKPTVGFQRPTEAAYKAKESVGQTNAVLVNQITKSKGVSVTAMGIYLYDGATLVKKYSEKVTNVPASQTKYHSWYDVNKELGVTLKKDHPYQYAFFGVFNGVEVVGSKFSFRTGGVAQYTANFVESQGVSYSLSVTKGQPYGTLPVPGEQAGKVFAGWYTQQGERITAATTFTASQDVTLYARYEDAPVQEETFTVTFVNPENMVVYGTYTVKNGDRFPIPSRDMDREGEVFLGWFTHVSGGTEITSSTVVDLTRDITLYPQWEDVSQDHTLLMQIGNPNFRLDGALYPIDSYGTVPLLKNGSTLLPVRIVIEAMGGSVTWIGPSQTVAMRLNGQSLNLQINSSTAWDGEGNTYNMGVTPLLLSGRTMLPIRFVAEFFGGAVAWHGETRTVEILFPDV